ncbi:MAG: glycosyltransferase family 2 protein [Chloroflexota bacterium]
MPDVMMYVIWLIIGLWVLIAWGQAWRMGRQARQQSHPMFMLASTPFVSILIPAWNERSTIAATLLALRESRYSEWEAVVIAGGPDGTEAYARDLCKTWAQFKVIAQPPRGKNAAFNVGYAEAKGDLIVLMDADCLVEPDWLANLLAPLTQGYSAAVANYFATEHTLISDQFEMEKILAYEMRGETTLHGGAIAVQRQIIEQIGRFPESVTVGVDWDFDVRVSRLGVRKAFARDAHHRTYLPNSLRRFSKDEIRWRRAHLQLTLGLMGNPSDQGHPLLTSLSFYIMGGLFFAALPIGLLGSLSLGSMTPLWLATAFMVWVLLRRVNPAISTLAYTGDRGWLPQLWVTPALLIVSFFSGLIALATLHKQIVFFQGPRPKVQKSG